jgi:hypothetical protein
MSNPASRVCISRNSSSIRFGGADDILMQFQGFIQMTSSKMVAVMRDSARFMSIPTRIGISKSSAAGKPVYGSSQRATASSASLYKTNVQQKLESRILASRVHRLSPKKGHKGIHRHFSTSRPILSQHGMSEHELGHIAAQRRM